MNQFQTELDIATIDYNKQLKIDLNAYFSAIKSSVVILDMFTRGLLSYYSTQFFEKSCQTMNLICNDAVSFNTLLKAPSDLYTETPNETFIEKTASFITKRYQAKIGIAVTGISNFEEKENKIYIGYSFYNNICSRMIECSGSQEIRYNQIINGVFGYLKMLFIKYPIINKRS
ncbi:hypothetical protein DID74_01245 [Candidatus Marinamargulisbacteria bacterium SCGC AG-333-B06]|nr:hypothetical protein DID74_01245 [Candidatus Marinamargulisbacteria bacterium SCGC AG-333-B06]